MSRWTWLAIIGAAALACAPTRYVSTRVQRALGRDVFFEASWGRVT